MQLRSRLSLFLSRDFIVDIRLISQNGGREREALFSCGSLRNDSLPAPSLLW